MDSETRHQHDDAKSAAHKSPDNLLGKETDPEAKQALNDAKSAVEILTLLRELNRVFEKTIVMVTHDPRAEAYVDHVIRLNKGVLENGGGPH